MKRFQNSIGLLFAALNIVASDSSSGAVTTYDFEGSSVPSVFSLTGNGGAFSQSLTSTNSYQGSQAFRLSLTCNGGSQWATTMNSLPELVQHVTFSIYDQYASNSPVYYYFFLQDSHDVPLTTIYGLDYADGGFGYPKSTSVLIFGSNTIPNYTRTVGWHVIDAAITNNSIEYKIDGNFLGSMATDPSIQIDMVGFGIANAGYYGENSLLIDNLSITTIPELSSALMGCAGFFGFILRRRR
jgi:hypothetical protein